MKSTVRRIAAPLTALVLAAALSSCGGGDDTGTSSEKKAITLWMYPVIGDQAASTAYWQKVESDF
jgi:multiple sugar transport system substrate-binding protein